MSLVTKIKSDSVQAIKDKDKDKLSTLRLLPYKYWGYKMCYNLKSFSFKWNKFRGLHK